MGGSQNQHSNVFKMYRFTDGWHGNIFEMYRCTADGCKDAQMGGMGAKTNVAKPFNDAAASWGSGLLVNLPALQKMSVLGLNQLHLTRLLIFKPSYLVISTWL